MNTPDSQFSRKAFAANGSRAAAVMVHVFLLASAFPPYLESESAWFALVPLVLLARYTRGLRRTFLWGMSAGFLFWLLNLAWLLRLSVTGGSWLAAASAWILLAAYCSIYTGAFTMLASHLFRVWMTTDGDEPETAMGPIRGQVSIVLALPLVWAGLEYLRGTLLTGFPWNVLAVSQFRNEGLIQLAAWGGVYCVSAVIMLANTGLAFTVLRFVDMFRRRRGPRFNLPMMIGLGGAMLLWLAGVQVGKSWRAENVLSDTRLVAVQPAVPQMEKWEPSQDLEIYDKLNRGTVLSSALRPAMIIWPETACPDLVNTRYPVASGFAATLTSVGVPILAGAIEYEFEDSRTNFYNSSILYDVDGMVSGVYRKMHLVPFGEFIPGEGWFPSLSRLAPLGFSCARGDEITVFKCGEEEVPFSALICFEDIFPSISRKAVRKGAKFLVNQTNDAWFDGSSGSVQHLANAVIRCTENRVAMVRCANTGVTCFINPLGQLDLATKEMLDASGRAEPEEGNKMGAVGVGPGSGVTFYNRYGDGAFGLPCAIGTVLVFALAVSGAYRKNKREERAGQV